MIVDNNLAKYGSAIKQLNYDPKQNTITPWVIVQTDQVLVIAKEKNSKSLFYFRKNPYNLIAIINQTDPGNKS